MAFAALYLRSPAARPPPSQHPAPRPLICVCPPSRSAPQAGAATLPTSSPLSHVHALLANSRGDDRVQRTRGEEQQQQLVRGRDQSGQRSMNERGGGGRGTGRGGAHTPEVALECFLCAGAAVASAAAAAHVMRAAARRRLMTPHAQAQPRAWP